MTPAEIISQNITAVILAGGASSRMGSDKALLEWHDRPFISHIVESLQPHVRHIAINTNSPADFAHVGLPLIGDATKERRGPLAGLMAALNYSRTDWTLIVPCDNPLLSPQLIDRLYAATQREHTDLAYAYSGDDNHYLYVLMRTQLRDHLATFMRGTDFAVRHWYATMRTTRVDFTDRAECFRNINNAADLAQLHSNADAPK